MLIDEQPLQAEDCHAFWSTTHEKVVAQLKKDGTISDSTSATHIAPPEASTIDGGSTGTDTTTISITRYPTIPNFELICPVVSETVVDGRHISSSIMRLGESTLKLNDFREYLS